MFVSPTRTEVSDWWFSHRKVLKILQCVCLRVQKMNCVWFFHNEHSRVTNYTSFVTITFGKVLIITGSLHTLNSFSGMQNPSLECFDQNVSSSEISTGSGNRPKYLVNTLNTLSNLEIFANHWIFDATYFESKWPKIPRLMKFPYSGEQFFVCVLCCDKKIR